MIEVINVRGLKNPPEGLIYVGRKAGRWAESPLGNPLRIGDESDRDLQKAQYKAWLWGKMQDEHSPQSKELRRIAEVAKSGDVKLGCWCAPKSCHADVIKAAVEYLISKGGGG